MLQSTSILTSYAMVLLCFIIQYSDGKYPVTISDPTWKYTPRLFGTSAVVYNKDMYVYGGQTALSFEVSNQLFKYSFDLEKKNVSMDSVYQANLGPNCTSCGAVMINENEMLILTHEYANTTNQSAKMEMVKPYTFNFRTHTWSVPSPENLPKYNETHKHEFVMRRLHSTILGSDGCVYVIGGQNFFDDNSYMYTSWYYDPKKNEYAILTDNRSRKAMAHSSAFNLPDGNIGVTFGFDHLRDYYSSRNMSVINVENKIWQENYEHLDGYPPEVRTGITVQTDSSKDYAYFFGGRLNQSQGKKFLNNTLEILDLRRKRWLTTKNTYETGAVVLQRYFSSSVIIDDTFITVFGTADEAVASELADLDIVPLPTLSNGISENPLQTTTVEWMSGIPESPGPDIIEKLKGHSTPYIAGATITAFLIFLIYLCSIKITVHKSSSDRKRTLMMPSVSINRRAGELFTTEIYSILLQAICIAIFGGVVGYLIYNTANSSISETEELEDIPYQILPDIRFCYTGYESNNESIPIPEPECRYENTQAGFESCTNNHIHELPKEIHMPSFPQQRRTTKCYMYKTANESMQLYSYNPTVQFTHVGGAYSEVEAVFIQFYEPSKNPNRVLFFNESPEAVGFAEMDNFKDSERRAGTSREVMKQILLAYPESDISVQYEVVHRKSIDPNRVWNYVGAYPIYILSTELGISHNDAIDRGRNKRMEPGTPLGYIRVTPNRFQNRVITEKRDTTILSVLGSIGGIVSVLFGLYAVLFGTKPKGPWGIVQKSSLIPSQKNKKLNELEDYFDISEVQGIPFVSPVHQRYNDIYNKNMSKNKKLEEEPLLKRLDIEQHQTGDPTDMCHRLEQLEGRNQILELVLKTYYVDDEIFRQLKKFRQRHPTSSYNSPITGDLENASDSRFTVTAATSTEPDRLKQT